MHFQKNKQHLSQKSSGNMLLILFRQMLVSPLANAIQQMHDKNMIHRDINPNNIMVMPDGGVRLLDFGTAKDFTAGKGGNTQLVATMGFSPPEQYIKGGNIGPWTDVYALCATMVYMVTGSKPPEAMERMLKDTLDLKPDKKSGLTEKVVKVLKAGLALQTGQRIQNMEELFSRLQKAADGNKNLKLAVAGAGVFGVLAVAAALGIYFRPGTRTWTEDGVTYTGKKAWGKIQGDGTAVYEDGRVYVGEFRKGIKEGEGVLYYPEDDEYDRMKYEGTFVNGEKQGKGIMIWKSGDRYEGDWVEGSREGTGVYQWADGRKYEGEWLKGEKSGTGVMTWKNGDRYDGEFKNDARNGTGILFYGENSQLDRYEGAFKNDKREGTGTFIRKDGGWIDGEWHNDNIEGKGTYYYAENDDTYIKYVGEFANGSWSNCEGVFYLKDGTIKKWKDNRLQD